MRPFGDRGRLAHDFHHLRLEMGELRSNPRLARPLFVKSLFYASLLAVYALRRALCRGSGRKLHFHPQIPDAEYTIWKVCALLGLKRSPPRPGARTVYVFDDNDLEPERLPELDPTTHRGPIVEKSDANARHDGRVIEAPLTTLDPACVYQRLIDYERPGGLVEDIRVPVVGASVPFIYLKYRPLETRFSNEHSFVLLREARDVSPTRRSSLSCLLAPASDSTAARSTQCETEPPRGSTYWT